jgi:hypothetical protein
MSLCIRTVLRLFLSSLFCVILASLALGQGDLPGGDLPPPGDWPACDTITCPTNYTCIDGVCVCDNWGDCGPCGGYEFYPYQECNIPVDGNVSFLLIAGLALAGFATLRTYWRR